MKSSGWRDCVDLSLHVVWGCHVQTYWEGQSDGAGRGGRHGPEEGLYQPVEHHPHLQCSPTWHISRTCIPGISYLSSLSIKDLYQVISEFQSSAVGRVGKGYTGREPGHRIWTFSSSLMFSMAIFTTIGQSYIISLLTFNTVSSSSSQIIVRLRIPSSEDSHWKDSEHILRSIGDPHHAPIQRYYWLNSGHQFQVSLHEAL